MASKFNLSKICQDAWFYARTAARGRTVAVRECLSDGFRSAWAQAKGHFSGRGPAAAALQGVLPRGAYATRPQLSYIRSLSGKDAPANITKQAASVMIDSLLLAKRSNRTGSNGADA